MTTERVNIWNRVTFLIAAVYFVQGAVAVSGMAEFLLTRNRFRFGWLELSFLSALVTLAWSIKPIYGFLTDLLPLFGSRRKCYLFCASALCSAGYLYLAFFGINFATVAVGLILANIGLGFSDVIVDGLIVERSGPKTVGQYQSIAWRARSLGVFLGALFSGLLIERAFFSQFLALPWFQHFLSFFPAAFSSGASSPDLQLIDLRGALFLSACLPLISFLATFSLIERPDVSALSAAGRREIPPSYILSAGGAFLLTAAALLFFASQKRMLVPSLGNDALASLSIIFIWSAWIFGYARHLVRLGFTSPALLYAALFLFLWRFSPGFDAPWSNYFLNTLKLSREKLGFAASLQPLAWLAGTFVYARFVDRFPLRKVLAATVILLVLCSFSRMLLTVPSAAASLGNIGAVRGLAALLLWPSYFLGYGFSGWQTAMTQPPILNLLALTGFFMEFIFMISFLPLLKLAALVTPKGVEATNFAVLMSIMNLGLAFGTVSGGILYTYIEKGLAIGGVSLSGLQLTVLISALMSMVCLAVLPRINTLRA